MAKLTTRFHRLLAGVGVAVSSIVSPTSMHVEPVQPEKKRKRESLQDALLSDSFMQHKDWEGIGYYDDCVLKHITLDDIVNFSPPDVNGHFWNKLHYFATTEDGSVHCVLEGTRNDDRTFSVTKKVEGGATVDDIFEHLVRELTTKSLMEAA